MKNLWNEVTVEVYFQMKRLIAGNEFMRNTLKLSFFFIEVALFHISIHYSGE